jgi:hypothetical protein
VRKESQGKGVGVEAGVQEAENMIVGAVEVAVTALDEAEEGEMKVHDQHWMMHQFCTKYIPERLPIPNLLVHLYR